MKHKLKSFEWHRWFAWYPIYIQERGTYGDWYLVWGEWIERKRDNTYSNKMCWKYRLPEPQLVIDGRKVV